MKATIDIPDELYRTMKARAALEGRPVRAVAVELFRRYVSGAVTVEADGAPGAEEPPIVIDGKAAPPWFGRARQYARKVADHGMDAVRESIAKGRASEVAEREARIRQAARK